MKMASKISSQLCAQKKDMVLYYESKHADLSPHPSYLIYVGKDKFENEDLIRFSWPEQDVWFHVDDLSSAHVYLRLHDGETIDSIPPKVLLDCAQLVKYNSIEGNKREKVDVVYTPCENLLKKSSFEVGQVAYKDESLVLKTRIKDGRNNDIVNRLNKTKTIKENPDLPWNWAWISLNPNITIDFIINNSGKPWNWQWISKNKFEKDKEPFFKEAYKKSDYFMFFEIFSISK